MDIPRYTEIGIINMEKVDLHFIVNSSPYLCGGVRIYQQSSVIIQCTRIGLWFRAAE